MKRKGEKPAETAKERAKEEPKEVSFPEDLGNRPQTQGPSREVKASEDEDEKFFLDLYPDLRKQWGAMFRKKSLSVSPPSTRRPSEPDIFLKRKMGLCGSINFLVLVTIGTGVYIAPSVVLEMTGSVLESLIVWGLSGFFSLLIALTYGELLFLVSQSGERFSFLLAAFSPFGGFFGPLPAFMTVWFDGILLAPAQVSMLALLMAEGFYHPFHHGLQTYYHFSLSEPIYLKQIIAFIALVIITSINFRTISTCLRVHLILGVFKAFILTFVIGGGVYSLSMGHTESFQNLTGTTKFQTVGFIKAMYQGMWAYEGWNNVVTVSEETKNPLWTIPRAVIIGLPLVTFLYLSMNIAFLSVLTPNEIVEASSAYIHKFEEKLFGSPKMIMPTFFALSALSCAMCIQMGVARSFFAAGREGHMMEIHSYLNVERFVPTPALLTQALISFIYIMYVPLIDLVEYAKFLTWTFYGFAFVALIVLRVREPDTHRLYKTPLAMPIIMTTVSVLVTLGPIYRRREFYTASSLAILGLIVYFLTVYKQARLFGMDGFNRFVQAVLNVAPPTALPEGYAHSESRSMTIAKSLGRRMRYYSPVGTVSSPNVEQSPVSTEINTS